jgi:predicted RNA-binding protein YlxR (DUF448 family)
MGEPVIEGLLVEPEPGRGARMRRCLGARGARPAASSIRFVLGPDRSLVPDLAGRLPGRGMWVGADRETLARVLARNQFAKAARGPVQAAADLVDQVEQMLVQRCLDRVGLARRAGELVVGFDQVLDWLRRGRCALVLVARDGAAEGRRRITAAAGGVPVLDPFGRTELGGAVGRAEAVHAGLAASGNTRRLLAELGRLRGFREFGMPDGHILSNAEDEGAARR